MKNHPTNRPDRPALHERPTIGRLARRLGWLVVPFALSLGGVTSCSGLGYTLGSLMRTSRDYDELDTERASAQAVARPRGMASPDARPYWTQYRGPRGDGVYTEQELALAGTLQPRVLWTAPVGPAYSSTVVAGGLAITMEQRRDEEAVVAFDVEGGSLVWEHAWPARFDHPLSKEGPRATPAVWGTSVVALGALGELRCMDLESGALRWRHALLEEGGKGNLDFGLSASPRIRAGLVFSQGSKHVSAFDLETGERRWTALDEGMGYATPQLGELLGRDHLVVSTRKRIVGLHPDSGAELWSFPWKFLGDACTQPILQSPNLVLASAGYGKGAQLVELTAQPDGIQPETVWKSKRLKTRYSEPVALDGRVYGLDEGILTCIDRATGKRIWKRGRYGYGQLLLHDGHLLVVDQEGLVHVLRLDPKGPVELTTFEGVDGGMTLNLPALAQGILFVRNERVLVALDLGSEAARGLETASVDLR